MKFPRAALVRLLILAALLVTLFAIGRATGLTTHLGPEKIRDVVDRAGPWGYVAYCAAFTLGELVHIPGMLFVAAGILAFGKLEGFFAALVGSVLSLSASFVLVRAVAGRVLAETQRPWLRRLLDHLEKRPVRTVALLRIFLWLAPSVNYGLALSHVRFRDYLVGSVIGLVPPVLGAALFFEWLFVRYAWLFH